MTNVSLPLKNSKKCILAVDDDEDDLHTLKEILLKQGYKVITAKNGQEALAVYLDKKPNLVIMDDMMPIVGGLEATAQIQKINSGKFTPVVVMVSSNEMSSIDEVYSTGAIEFVRKPLNWHVLLNVVEHALKLVEYEASLLDLQHKLTYTQELAKVVYWEWTVQTDRLFTSPLGCKMFGIAHLENPTMKQCLDNIIPKDLPIVFEALENAKIGEGALHLTYRIKNQQGETIHIDSLADCQYDDSGVLIGMKGSAQDITRLHKAEQLIAHQEKFDLLTNLPNRRYFNKLLQEFIEQEEHPGLSAVVVLDIDQFKKTNDTLGQHNGDILLKNVALRLKNVTRKEDIVARQGSDEFAILIKFAKDKNELIQSTQRVFNDLARAFMIESKELFFSFSMGVCEINEFSKTSNQLVAHANVARTSAKSAGGNQLQFYQQSMNAESQKYLMLENDLRSALKRKQIEVYYQPQVDAKSHKLTGFEALARWNHPAEGLVSPVVFIPMAEVTGLIVEIGQFVLETAVAEVESWDKLGFKNLHIGINLSPRQFVDKSLVERIQKVLNNTSLDNKYIDLEITESLMVGNAEHHVIVLNKLKDLGISLLVDDFGTGYSSLSYLQKFPIDTLKVDQSFVRNLDTKEGKGIVNAILAMVEALNLGVIVEGVENESDINFFKNKNAQSFQGFYFGKPLPAKETRQILANFMARDK